MGRRTYSVDPEARKPASCRRPVSGRGCAENCGGNRRDDSVGVVVASPQTDLACRLLDPYQESFVPRSVDTSNVAPPRSRTLVTTPTHSGETEHLHYSPRHWRCASRVSLTLGPQSQHRLPMTPHRRVPTGGDDLAEVTVTAERLSLMGKATTASEGIVVNEEPRPNPRLSSRPAAGDSARPAGNEPQRRGQGKPVPDARLQPGPMADGPRPLSSTACR